MMQAQTFRGPLGWSIASVLVMAGFLVYALLTLINPLLSGGIEDATDSHSVALLQKYDEYVTVDVERFNGRSAFYNPIRIAPPAPPPREVEPIEEPPEVPEAIIDPGPPPAPATYTGPPLIAIIGDEAWFRSNGTSAVIVLRAGEEQDGLKLVKTMLPSQVTVEHRRGVYDVPLFTNEEPFFSDEPPVVSENDFFEKVEG